MGSPIQIVKFSEDNHFELDSKALSDILLKDSIRDKPVVVVSIVGDFRKGKSFMLNFFVRYLQYGCSDDWLDDTQIPMKGFSWRSGCERETTGIFIWSEPFIFELIDGREVVIVLMDTQGINDSQTTTANSALVFALSTLISSIQIFNLMHNLQEDNFQVLEYYTEYGRLALEDSNKKPFQNLIILIRDWNWPTDHPFGEEGGKSLLDEFLKRPQMIATGQRIRSLYSEIGGYLMPEPGKKVKRDGYGFCGMVSDIDEEFIQHLKIFVPNVFDPDRITLKNIGGQAIKAMNLIDCFENYFQSLNGESMPKPMDLYEANVCLQHELSFKTVIEDYLTEMDKQFGNDMPYSESIETKHNELKSKAVNDFEKRLKMKSKKHFEDYKKKLETKIEQAYKLYKEKNDAKNAKKGLKYYAEVGIGIASGAVMHALVPTSGAVAQLGKGAATAAVVSAGRYVSKQVLSKIRLPKNVENAENAGKKLEK